MLCHHKDKFHRLNVYVIARIIAIELHRTEVLRDGQPIDYSGSVWRMSLRNKTNQNRYHHLANDYEIAVISDFIPFSRWRHDRTESRPQEQNVT